MLDISVEIQPEFAGLSYSMTIPHHILLMLQPLTLLPNVTVNGAASVDRLVRLPRNGIVEPPFIVTVQAGRAEWTLAGNAGRLRTQDISTVGQVRTSVVLDFGVLRTVAAVAVRDASQIKIIQVKPWTGVGFGAQPVFYGGSNAEQTVITDTTPALTVTPRALANFPSEIRTERLQIDLIGNPSEAVLATNLLVQLPDVPADLDIRINGGPPVWSAPGTVVAGVAGWQPVLEGAGAAQGLLQQTVDLSAALSALLSDPSALPTDLVDLHIVLSARVPGALSLELPPASSQVVHHVTRVTFEQGTRELTFTNEGRLNVSLPLPPWAKRLARLQLGVSAKLPPARTRPAVGPAALTITQDGETRPFAELILDADHAGAAAIPRALCTEGWHLTPAVVVNRGALVQLSGVRLPLRAGADGAEARALFLTNIDDEPGAPMDGGTSAPVTIDAPTSDDDVWTTFTFPAPIRIDPDALPFVGITVSRGTLTWALTASVDGGQLWRGPPTGPLQALPTLGALASLYGRFRIIGTAAADRPVAPLLMLLQGATGNANEVTPTPKGVTVLMQPATPVDVTSSSGAVLEVISHVAGAVTIHDVLAIVTSS